jgi:hypothetical protein
MGILKFKEKRTLNLYKNTSGSRVKEDFSVGDIFYQIGFRWTVPQEHVIMFLVLDLVTSFAMSSL